MGGALQAFDGDVKNTHIQHHGKSTPDQIQNGMTAASTYYFPNSSMTVSYASPEFARDGHR